MWGPTKNRPELVWRLLETNRQGMFLQCTWILDNILSVSITSYYILTANASFSILALPIMKWFILWFENIDGLMVDLNLNMFRLELEMVPSTHTIHDVARLINSDRLRSVMTRMDEFAEKPRKPQDLIGWLQKFSF